MRGADLVAAEEGVLAFLAEPKHHNRRGVVHRLRLHALVALNSAVTMPPAVHEALVVFTSLLLSAALAAMGLETDLGKLKAKGLRPLALGAMAWVLISVLGLALIVLSRY